MILLFYTLAFMVIGLMLLALAQKPVMLQAMQPALINMVAHLSSRRAKHAYRGFYLLFRALAKLFLLLVAGVLALFALGSDDEDKEKAEGRWHDGSFWQRDTCGVWYSHDANDDSSPPS